MASIPKYNHPLHSDSKNFKEIKSNRLMLRHLVKCKMRTQTKSNRNLNKVYLKKMMSESSMNFDVYSFKSCSH
mgnify:CR=1 FL=1